MRMKYSANWIRQGQGGFMVPREAPVTEALDKLSDDLKQAQNALNNSKQGVGQNSDLERSLARVERLRSQMERMAGRGQQQNGDQSGQQQGGQQQGGQQQGAQGQVGQGGSRPTPAMRIPTVLQNTEVHYNGQPIAVAVNVPRAEIVVLQHDWHGRAAERR